MLNRWSFVMVVSLAACGSKAAPPVTPQSGSATAPAASGPVEGHGWTTEPDVDNNTEWIWSNEDASDVSTMALGTEPGGRGILALTLPNGARSATVKRFLVTYGAPGEGTWSVFTTATDGAPTGEPAMTHDVSVSAADVIEVGQSATYTKATQVDLGAGVPVTGPFYLVFETRSGQPTVLAAAGNGGASHVSYQPPGGAPHAAPYRAFIRVTLFDVK